MTDIDPKAIDAAVKAMDSIVEGSKFPSTFPWRIDRVDSNGSFQLVQGFSDKAERDRTLGRMKARAAIMAYLEFMREEASSA